MYFLYSSISIGIVFLAFRIFNYIFFPKLKTFEDSSDYFDSDEYILLCYRIKHKDLTETIITDEISEEELEEINTDNEIKYVVIDYLYNNKFMKYITYSYNIDFPIYDIDVDEYRGEQISTILLNGEDVTTYVKPFLGPKNNFYNDKKLKIKLENMFDDHPHFSKLNFEDGNIEIIAISGKKIYYDLPWTPVWKQFSGKLDNTVEINHVVNNNKSSSSYGFTIVDKNLFD